MAETNVTTDNGMATLEEILESAGTLSEEGHEVVKAAAGIFQRGGCCAYLLQRGIKDAAREAGLISDSRKLIIGGPVPDLYDASVGLDFIADGLEEDQPGAANLLRVLGRQVSTIADHLDNNNWGPRKTEALGAQ